MSKPFFQSVKHPHCQMNRFGIVFVPNGHADGVDYWGKSFDRVPLRPGLLDLHYAVEYEAYDAGYRYRYERGETIWSKPSNTKPKENARE